jgi:hypothetical protein
VKRKKSKKNPKKLTSETTSRQSTPIKLSEPLNELSDKYSSNDDTIVFQAFGRLIKNEQPPNEPTSPIKKRTRIRKRKNKQKTKEEGDVKGTAYAIVEKEVAADPPRKFRSETQEFWINPYPNRKHIKFDDNEEENIPELSNTSQTKRARLLKPLEINLQASETPKLQSPEHNISQSMDIELEASDKPTLECIIVDENSNANTSSDAASSPVSVIEKKISSNVDATVDDYSDLKIDELDLPSVVVLPKKSDVLAFKILKMNASYEPVVSNFIIGVVEEVEEASLDICFLIKSKL